MSAAIRRLEVYRNIVYLFLFFCMKFMAKYTDVFYDKTKKQAKHIEESRDNV